MSKKHRLASDINVVPYIDVMLVLLVIFMVTAPLLTQGVKVELPQANSQLIDGKPDDEPLIVSIKADGSLYVNLGDAKEAQKPLAEIKEMVKKVVASKPATQVLVWGDHRIEYGKVVALMSQLQGIGVQQVGLVTEPGNG
ncbi:Biopolymer transport protein ExbD [BD1-7 clade bacterium]|uniref:Tol-Pal system protein TolR n=1 Tax=BD1-7 clade bacterium TaxID=2029982 RepID=A0A5S9MQG1_9GAMM|nr:Biopolymer transport protein ExbD [BD1-7 clade bacterium]